MTNRQEVVLKGFLGSIIIGIVLGVYLIPNYGIEGSAIVSVSIMIFWNVIMACYCFRALSINTLPVGNINCVKVSINKKG